LHPHSRRPLDAASEAPSKDILIKDGLMLAIDNPGFGVSDDASVISTDDRCVLVTHDTAQGCPQHPACWHFVWSMPKVARCNTIEISEPVVCIGSKIEACDQFQQTLIGAVRGCDRQRFLIKSFDIAGDEMTQQLAQGPLLGLVRAQDCEFLLEGVESSQAVVLLRKPRV
jgi:hypothetical protein